MSLALRILLTCGLAWLVSMWLYNSSRSNSGEETFWLVLAALSLLATITAGFGWIWS